MAVFATGQMSSVLQQEVLNRYLKNTTVLAPVATVYVALATAIPTDAGFTEVTNANGYARQSCAISAVTAGPPSYVTNSGIINFPTVTSTNWAAVVGWGIYDSGTYGAGNLLFYGTLGNTVAFSAVSVASPGVMTTAANGLTAGTSAVVNILTSTATLKDMTGATGTGVGPCQVDVIGGTSVALPYSCTVTGTGTVMVPSGTVTCNVGDVFQFAANALTIYLD
jgi:hypothetical protein